MKDITVKSDISVKDALKKLDECATKVLIVVGDEEMLIGTLTDGDVRRFIITEGDLNDSIDSVYNKVPKYLIDGEYDEFQLKRMFTENKIELIPVVNKEKKYLSYLSWDCVIDEKKEILHKDRLKDIPIVIMAGGKGTRLKPFTDVLPKPLVPVHEKPIMDWIIEEFVVYGAQKFFSTLNYRGKMIEAYYGSIEKDYSIDFIWEKEFLGTAGSLELLKDKIEGTFIVSNCDIIVKANYADVLNFHKDSNAIMTIISSIQHHQIPYGVLEFGDGGVVSKIKEKPEYTHAINTGVYILEKECLDIIPEGKFYHITHLIDDLIKQGCKVITYPVNEKEYVDIGQWEEYMSAVDNFQF